MYLFWHTLKIGLINAWLLYRRDCELLRIPTKQVMNHRQFQAQVATSLIHVNIGTKRSPGRPPSASQNHYGKAPTPPKRISKGPNMDVRKDELAHWPIKVEKRGRCKLCKENNTDTACEKCGVRLCFTEKRNCFRQFHV